MDSGRRPEKRHQQRQTRYLHDVQDQYRSSGYATSGHDTSSQLRDHRDLTPPQPPTHRSADDHLYRKYLDEQRRRKELYSREQKYRQSNRDARPKKHLSPPQRFEDIQNALIRRSSPKTHSPYSSTPSTSDHANRLSSLQKPPRTFQRSPMGSNSDDVHSTSSEMAPINRVNVTNRHSRAKSGLSDESGSSGTSSGSALNDMYDDDDAVFSDRQASTLNSDHFDRYDMMVEYIYSMIQQNNWHGPEATQRYEARLERLATHPNSQSAITALATASKSVGAVTLRIGNTNEYKVLPPCMKEFAISVAGLNVSVAIKIVSSLTYRILTSISPTTTEFTLMSEGGILQRVQILDTISQLPRARKHHFAAFIRDELAIVIWGDGSASEVENIIEQGKKWDRQMISVVWRGVSGGNDDIFTDKDRRGAIFDLEGDAAKPRKRHKVYLMPLITGLTIIIICILIGLQVKALAMEVVSDRYYMRLLLLLTAPINFALCMFFAMSIVLAVVMIFGPVSQVFENSLTYSAIAPKRISGKLPHMTIQCPVYKESLQGVIEPTIRSLQKAVSTYELQGGTVNIFINDDGMQLLSKEERKERIEFYEANSIGWVARPPHGKQGFIRAGRFKKASNMNYCLHLSNLLEKKLERYQRGEKWSAEDEDQAYKDALAAILEEDGTAWASGDIRIGDYILLVDSDTRVPEDCLLDAASEFSESPEVAIIQHVSGIMQVVFNYWGNCISYFTNLIYFAIRYSAAGGDVAPFVGHNAFLRWAAVQELGYKENGMVKYWAENMVSEDFEMALRLQIKGYKLRLASYHGKDFQEGVSLTVYDELSRWQKYAYGCSELLFHPLKDWLRRGPFTKEFRAFVTARNIPGFAKFTITSYIFTYYALGSCWIFITLNYFIFPYYGPRLDHWYQYSLNTFIACIFVFNIVGPVANAVSRYRLKEKNFFLAFGENLMWLSLLALYFGGVSIHVSKALLCHLFSIPIQWGSTNKEFEVSNFFKELPKIAKNLLWLYLICTVGIVTMIVFAFFVPDEYRINNLVSCLPMGWLLGCHFLLPIALNPQLMTFTF